MRQPDAAIERGQTLHHRLDKVRVGLKKSGERLLHELVRALTAARRQLDKAGFLFRCQVHLHETKLATSLLESRLRPTLRAIRPYGDRRRVGPLLLAASYVAKPLASG